MQILKTGMCPYSDQEYEIQALLCSSKHLLQCLKELKC